MAQSARKAAVVRVDNAPPRALGSRRGRSNSVLPRYLRTGRPYPGATAGAYGPRARVIRVADPVGVVATCLLGHNFALRYPGPLGVVDFGTEALVKIREYRHR